MAVGCAVFASADASLPFIDVVESDWFYPYVETVFSRGFVKGTSEDTFSPNTDMTRAMFVTIIGRMHGAEPFEELYYSDVPAGTWYTGYVAWAARAGIVKGYPDGTFAPDKTVSRQELALMLYRYLDYAWLDAEKGEAVSFSDEEAIASWARDAVKALASTGIVTGYPNGSFGPEETATRAEVSTMACRLLTLIDSIPSTASIGDTPLTSFSLYSSEASSALLSEIAEAISGATGVSLPVSGEKGESSIVFGVDSSIYGSTYAAYMRGNCLHIDVSNSYALPYLPEIMRDFFASRNRVDIPSTYNAIGVYDIPALTDVTDSAKSFEIVLHTEKSAVSYSAGDKILMVASVIADGALVSVPKLEFSISSDKAPGSEVILKDCSAGYSVLEWDSTDAEGFVRITVTPTTAKGVPLAAACEKVSFSGGLGLDVLTLVPTAEKPDDFDSFWSSQMEEFMKVSPEMTVYRDLSNEDYTVYDLRITATDGEPATGFLVIPKNAETGSLPIRMHCESRTLSPAEPIYREDAISLYICAHSMASDGTDEYYDEMKELIGSDYGRDESATRENCYYRNMFFRFVQGLRYAKTLPQWDGERITVEGGSFGGFVATALAYFDPDVTEIDIFAPGQCDMAGNGLGGRVNADAPKWNKTQAYYDTCFFAESVKCKVNVQVGLGDSSCPPRTVTALYNSFDCEKRITYIQNAGHGGGKAHSDRYTVTGGNIDVSPSYSVTDAGSYLTKLDPNSDNRNLSAEEEALKAILETVRRPLLTTFGSSDTLTEASLGEEIVKFLEKNYKIPAGCTVTIEENSMYALKDSYSKTGENTSITRNIEYTVYLASGGYYTAELRASLTKKIPA